MSADQFPALDDGHRSGRSSLLGRRWVRWMFVVIVSILVGLSLRYKFFVEPTLTGRQLHVWVAGDDARVDVDIDRSHSTVRITGAQGGLPNMAVSDGALYVQAGDVGVVDKPDTWIEVPLSEIDPRFSALTAPRLFAALNRGTKDCRRFNADAVAVLSLFLRDGAVSGAPAGELCEESIFAGATKGKTLIVAIRAVRPGDLSGVPADARPLSSIDSADEVIGSLNQLMGRLDP